MLKVLDNLKLIHFVTVQSYNCDVFFFFLSEQTAYFCALVSSNVVCHHKSLLHTVKVKTKISCSF